MTQKIKETVASEDVQMRPEGDAQESQPKPKLVPTEPKSKWNPDLTEPQLKQKTLAAEGLVTPETKEQNQPKENNQVVVTQNQEEDRADITIEEPQAQTPTRASSRNKRQTRFFGRSPRHAVTLVDMDTVPVLPSDLAQPEDNSPGLRGSLIPVSPWGITSRPNLLKEKEK